MNEFVLVGGTFAVCAVALVSFVFYSVYGGQRTQLANAKEGQIFNFVYSQPLSGTNERFLAKVIGKQTLTVDQIATLNRNSRYRSGDPDFVRTANLVTCRTPDGRVRNFYAERVQNCRRPLLAGVLFKAGVGPISSKKWQATA